MGFRYLVVFLPLLTLPSRSSFHVLFAQVRDEALKAGIAPARESVWSYFVSKCSNNLHIVLAMSPSGDTLRTRCRNFPGLVSSTVIDWFMPWPKQALHAVASVFLGEVSFFLQTDCQKRGLTNC